jgi:hypothetical protein
MYRNVKNKPCKYKAKLPSKPFFWIKYKVPGVEYRGLQHLSDIYAFIEKQLT